MMHEYRRLAILELLQGSPNVPHVILVDELERLAVPGTDAEITDDAEYLKKAGAIAIDAINSGREVLHAYRLLVIGDEHLKRKRSIPGVSRARWKKV